MKRIILLFAGLLGCHLVQSQQMIVGPKVGGGLSRAVFEEWQYKDSYQSHFTYAYQGGIVVNYKVNNVFSLHTEYLYAQAGKRVKGKETQEKHTERFNYLSVPLLLRTSFRRGYTDYYFNIGPNLQYWLGGHGNIMLNELIEPGYPQGVKYDIFFGEGQTSFEEVYSTRPNRLQLGLDMGCGAMLPIKKQFLMLDLRYTWGHTHLGKEGGRYLNFLFYEDNLQHANHLITLSVAYLFEFDFLEMKRGKSDEK